MNNTEKKYFDEEQVKDYLMDTYIEALNAACEYAATEPQITRISVLWLGDYCIEVAVWLYTPVITNKRDAHPNKQEFVFIYSFL